MYDTLRGLPAIGDKDTRALGALTQLMDVILTFRDTEVALPTYNLFHRHIAHSGATGTGVVFLSGSLHWPLRQASRAARPHRGCAEPLPDRRDHQRPHRRPSIRDARQA